MSDQKVIETISRLASSEKKAFLAGFYSTVKQAAPKPDTKKNPEPPKKS